MTAVGGVVQKIKFIVQEENREQIYNGDCVDYKLYMYRLIQNFNH